MKAINTLATVMVLIMMVFCLPAFADEKPSFDFDLYGKIKLDGAYDQNLTSHGNFVIWVKSPEADGNDEQFNMTANETRFGIKITGKGYQSVSVDGKIEFDLFAGVSGATVAENKAMLQLRHAYFAVSSGNTKLLAGQTYDLISPLNPATLNYPVLWGCGNIGYRRPQISLWHTFKGESTDFTMAGGFFRTIGTDLTPTFTLAAGETSEGSDDGTDAGIPSLQTRLDINHNFSSGSSLRFGVSGLWGQLKAETNQGNSQTYKSWMVGGHFKLSHVSGIGIMGEAFTGENLQSYLGGILNNSTVDGLSTFGGWGSAWVQLSPKAKFSAGFGLDDPDNDQILSGRSRNFSIFGNITYNLVSNVVLGFEVSNWETEYKDVENNLTSYSNLRGQTSLILMF